MTIHEIHWKQGETMHVEKKDLKKGHKMKVDDDWLEDDSKEE